MIVPIIKNLNKYLPFFLLLIVLIIGTYVRFNNLGEASLWIDEGYSINAAGAILEHGKPLLPSGHIYDNQPLAAYAIAESIAVFGFNPTDPWSARAPAAFFGVLVILITFIFARRVFKNDWLALGAAIFIAFLPWEIAWSRQARGYTMLQFFLLVSFSQLFVFLKSKKILASMFSIAAFVLAYFSHALAIVFIPGILFTLAAWFIAERRKVGSLTKLWVPILITITGVLYLGIRFIKHIEIVNYLNDYNSFIIEHYLVLALLGLFGLIILVLRSDINWSGTLLLGTTTTAYVIISAYGINLQYRYLVPLLPLIGFGVVYSFYFIIHFFPKLLRLPQKKIISSVFSTLLLTLFLLHGNFIQLEPTSTLYRNSPQPNFEGAYEYIIENITQEDIMISPYAHLNKIYLNNPGALMPISLTGRQSELAFTITSNNTDYYTDAPVMYPSELLSSTDTLNGFLLIDRMARQRMPKEFDTFMNSQNFQIVYFSPAEENGGGIWVFKF